ncbi:enhancer of ag-4 protein 2 [Phtheirospermum japonicum]|uniref:Enhancer of ag-4 protein 2 n=1 Tax=Phtheirospermum japonicum TaxID=374723 RepID=A0A830CBM1_9LAMI|nr:enhancer of ag-4 protein 2 [Phtheirospermum japonicum]
MFVGAPNISRHEFGYSAIFTWFCWKEGQRVIHDIENYGELRAIEGVENFLFNFRDAKKGQSYTSLLYSPPPSLSFVYFISSHKIKYSQLRSDRRNKVTGNTHKAENRTPAPFGRKRGAKGVKTMSELSLGDLVLAKVKGFPAWPAKLIRWYLCIYGPFGLPRVIVWNLGIVANKIGRPEDWDRAPDPKKYFVQFFGTEEIAFVAPGDIQAFTSESKNKLSARCQGKTVKYFAQAVEEICEEFDRLQRKKISSIRDNNNAQNLASEAHSVDPMVDEALELSADEGIDSEGPNCKLETNGLSDQESKGEMEFQDVKPCSSDDINHSSPANISSGKRRELSENLSNPVKESVLGSVPSSRVSIKVEGSRNVKVEGFSDGGQSELANGHKSKPAIGLKRKHEDTMRRNSGSVISPEHIGDGMKMKYASAGKVKGLSTDNSRFGSDLGSERKLKKLLKEKKRSTTVDGRVDAEVTEEHNEVISRKKMKFQHDHGKLTTRTIESSNPAKKSKSADVVDGVRMPRDQTSRKNPISPADLDDKMDKKESKRLPSGGKAENYRSFRPHTSNNEPNHSTSEADPTTTKRHSRVGGSSALISENINGDSATGRNGLVSPNKVRPSGVQLQTKRRAVRICDDDDDELSKTPVHGGLPHKVSAIPLVSEPKKKNITRGELYGNDRMVLRNSDDELTKTPVHGGSSHKASAISQVSESKKKTVVRGEAYGNDRLVVRNSGIIDDASKEQVLSSRLSNKTSSLTAQKGMEKRTRESSAEHVSRNQRQLDPEKLPSVEAKSVTDATPSVTAVRPLAEPQKKHFSKTPVNISQKKLPSGANRGLNTASDGSSLTQSINEKSKPTSPGEKRKTTPLSKSQINDSVPLVGNPDESIAAFGERLDVGDDSKTSLSVNSKFSDSVTSMKHLIAAAQARKKQAHFQNPYANHISLLVSDTGMFGRSPSPTPGILAVESNKTLQLDVQRLDPNPPSSDVRQIPSVNEHENDEFEERRVSSGHQATGSSLSGDTEAAVARDAFEGMIETLSRTKESIGRATRHAIDCAKYGITNEVVELLIRKLENEPSFHRRVDLFFLVDSITQCSHSQKGIAGASYIPIVQAALPRLIGAAAPPGTGAQENRRQCHKVLRLWLERKILPESVLRRYIDGIGAAKDETSIGVSHRRPSRAERSIDDPIRDMEGMFVDEYGSMAKFQLPGFLPSHFFEEEEEEEEDEGNFPTGHKEVQDTSPSDHNTPASRDPDQNCTVTPSDRRHCILEDVDGELEMEDVSAHQKDEAPFSGNDSAEVEPNPDVIFQSSSSMSELLLSPESSPPLPPGSPPPTPPLPTSPPPSCLPPPPPPPPSSPSPPPPPPPPPSSQPHLFPPPPAGPPSFRSDQSLPPPPALMPQHMPPHPPTISSSQPPLSYHPPHLPPHDISGTPTGNQHNAHMVTNTHGPRIDPPVRGEVFSQQSSFYSPAAVSNVREHVGYNSSRLVEHGQGTQVPQLRQPFLPGSAPFAQRPLHPEPITQQLPSHFSYPNSGQQNMYPSYSVPNYSDGLRRNATDEQWPMQANEFSSDCSRRGWMTGGYYGPPIERPPTNVVSFQPSAASSLPAAAPISVHGVQMMPSRPDVSAVNWRPA